MPEPVQSYPIARRTKYNPVPPETKALILSAAKERIFGETILQIAQSYGIDKVTLNMWLLADDDYAELRQAATDHGILSAQDEMETAGAEYESVVAKARAADKAVQGAIDTATNTETPLTVDELNALVAQAKIRKVEIARELDAAQFTLSRAREVFNGRFKVAQVRDPRFASKQLLDVRHVDIGAAMSEARLRVDQGRTFEHDAAHHINDRTETKG